VNNFFLRSISILLILPFFLFIIYINNFFFLFLLFLILVLSICEIQFLYIKNKNLFILLVFLILLFLLCLFLLRGSTIREFYYLLWIMCIVWFSDVGGYVVGKIFGGKKLTKWSPKKTISGVVGSLLFSQFAILILQIFIKNIIFSFNIFLIQLTLSITSIAGDIFFSIIKRKNNIKDYSNFIPGHGGVLDRIDGLIFVIIISFLLKFFHVY